MKPFAVVGAEAEADAVARVAADPAARFVAGGTTLVDLMKLDVETPELLVDIGRLPLDAIEELPDGSLRIGALARNADVASDERVQQRWPALAEALLAGASPQLRNMATVGGNLLQRTRCTYFRDATSACNKRVPGSGCDALEGHHRSHAVLGTSDACFASYPGDMSVALVALGATVQTLRPDGATRDLAVEALHVPYGESPAREHVLHHGELVTSVTVPALPWLAASTYTKARDRSSFEFALASAAVALDVDPDEGTIRDARVALGGIATTPWRSLAAEAALRGRSATQPIFAAAAQAALADATPRRDTAFKIELARRIIVRALRDAAALQSVPGNAA